MRVWTAAAHPPMLKLVALGLLFGCSRDPLETGPKDAELKNRLAFELPAHLSVDSLDVEASQNVGDRVEPIFKTRFKAEAHLTADTFVEAERSQNAVILSPVRKNGEHLEIYGIALSSLKGGSWETHFQLDENPVAGAGKPRDAFGGAPVYIKGSPEEASYREDLRVAEVRRREEEATRQEELRLAEVRRREQETARQEELRLGESRRRQEEVARREQLRQAQVEKLKPGWHVKISPEELVGKVWEFGRADGTVLVRGMSLQADGSIDGSRHENESRWGTEGAVLVFYHSSGRASTRFTSFVKSDGRWTISGPFLLGGDITHVLKEMP